VHGWRLHCEAAVAIVHKLTMERGFWEEAGASVPEVYCSSNAEPWERL
jgi:hypothetical protein